jgi:hypothetical protein
MIRVLRSKGFSIERMLELGARQMPRGRGAG